MRKHDDLYELSPGFIAQAERDFALYAELEARGQLPEPGELPGWMADGCPIRRRRRIEKRRVAALARGDKRR